MTKSGRIITGILSFLPIVLFIGQFVIFLSLVFPLFLQGFDTDTTVAATFDITDLMFLMMINMSVLSVIGIGMLIYLLIHANKNPKFNDDDRLMWVILLVVLGILIFPLYWYIAIWKDKPIE